MFDNITGLRTEIRNREVQNRKQDASVNFDLLMELSKRRMYMQQNNKTCELKS
jgi:hypothetical protein